jgi:TolB-like protein
MREAVTLLKRALSIDLSCAPAAAMVPFANISGDPEQEYFGGGMVEEIITPEQEYFGGGMVEEIITPYQ